VPLNCSPEEFAAWTTYLWVSLFICLSVVYLKTMSAAQTTAASNDMTINEQWIIRDVEGTESELIWDNILQFVCRDRGRPQSQESRLADTGPPEYDGGLHPRPRRSVSYSGVQQTRDVAHYLFPHMMRYMFPVWMNMQEWISQQHPNYKEWVTEIQRKSLPMREVSYLVLYWWLTTPLLCFQHNFFRSKTEPCQLRH
jgi:hypothetical protein